MAQGGDRIEQPALGRSVNLGMLYDYRCGEFYSGFGLWDHSKVNGEKEEEEEQRRPPGSAQYAEFKLSTDTEESRKDAGLDDEASLGLELGVIKATGSAKYLTDRKTSKLQERVDLSCTTVVRTRRIPQETLSQVQYQQNFENKRFTHFVSEVREGGTFTLSFVRTYTSQQHKDEMRGKLEATFRKLVDGMVNVTSKSDEDASLKDVKVSYSGTWSAGAVGNMEDATRVMKEAPDKIREQHECISFVLLPLSIVGAPEQRFVGSLDSIVIKDAADALRDGEDVLIDLAAMKTEAAVKNTFKKLEEQIGNFSSSFDLARLAFRGSASELLIKHRKGDGNENDVKDQLSQAVHRYKEKIKIGKAFVDRKRNEEIILNGVMKDMKADPETPFSLTQDSISLLSEVTPRLMLALGNGVNCTTHPLQARLDPMDRDSSAVGYGKEWYENQDLVHKCKASFKRLRELQRRRKQLLPYKAMPAVEFCVTTESTLSNGDPVELGDILLGTDKLIKVMEWFSCEVPPPVVSVCSQHILTLDIEVAWQNYEAVENVLGTRAKGVLVRWCRGSDSAVDGAYKYKYCDRTKVPIESIRISQLEAGCAYDVQVALITIVGPTDWSTPTSATPRAPCEPELLSFYTSNAKTLGHDESPWRFNKTTRELGVGCEVQTEICVNPDDGDGIAVQIVDVAPQFKPEIAAADINDPINTKVLVLSGPSRVDKTAQLNALLSYLYDFQHGQHVVPNQTVKRCFGSESVMGYRIRPTSPKFNGNTLLILDLPCITEAPGPHSSSVMMMISHLTRVVKHVNAAAFAYGMSHVDNSLMSQLTTIFGQVRPSPSSWWGICHIGGEKEAPVKSGGVSWKWGKHYVMDNTADEAGDNNDDQAHLGPTTTATQRRLFQDLLLEPPTRIG